MPRSELILFILCSMFMIVYQKYSLLWPINFNFSQLRITLSFILHRRQIYHSYNSHSNRLLSSNLPIYHWQIYPFTPKFPIINRHKSTNSLLCLTPTLASQADSGISSSPTSNTSTPTNSSPTPASKPLGSSSSQSTCPCSSKSYPRYQSSTLPSSSQSPWTSPTACTKHTHLPLLQLRKECHRGIRNRSGACSKILSLNLIVPSVIIHGACGITSSTHLHCLVISTLYHSVLIVGPALVDIYPCVVRYLSGHRRLQWPRSFGWGMFPCTA